MKAKYEREFEVQLRRLKKKKSVSKVVNDDAAKLNCMATEFRRRCLGENRGKNAEDRGR